MKAKFLSLSLAYAACLVLLATETQAKAKETRSVDDLSSWTKDQVQAYLDKYQIVYDKNANDDTLLTTVKKYRDAAMANANIFINNQSDVVNRLIDAAKIKLTSSYKLSSENANDLINDIQHSLKQLELSGALTRDKVKHSLDKLQHKAVKQKIITESQFKELAKDIEDSFYSPTWYQRLLNWAPSTSDVFPDDSYHTWLKSTITNRLQENKELTKEQIAGVVDTLKSAISSASTSASDLSKLGDAKWWQKLGNDLEKNAKLKQNQVESVIDSLRDEVTAYKIFAMDYASETSEQTQHVFARAGQYLKDTGNTIYEKVVHPLKSNSAAASASVSSAASVASEAATSATDAAAESASILRAKATESVNDAQNSFGHYWRQKELDSYRKLGYTEAHIEWIQNYLSKTFTDKKNLTKDTVYNAIRTIRQYLVQAKVQTAAHIDAQLKSLEELIEYWRRHAVRDEL
ncbi:hypothetical protein RMATCC62417_11694 [Rhizopus microsporus]|nr:hypothetical protein RMATCC62417_11694 [Rhizopus microsporus]